MLSMHFVPGLHTQFEFCMISAHSPVRVKFIRERTRRAYPLLLVRSELGMEQIAIHICYLRRIQLSVIRRNLFVAGLLNGYDKLVPVQIIQAGIFCIIGTED